MFPGTNRGGDDDDDGDEGNGSGGAATTEDDFSNRGSDLLSTVNAAEFVPQAAARQEQRLPGAGEMHAHEARQAGARPRADGSSAGQWRPSPPHAQQQPSRQRARQQPPPQRRRHQTHPYSTAPGDTASAIASGGSGGAPKCSVGVHERSVFLKPNFWQEFRLQAAVVAACAVSPDIVPFNVQQYHTLLPLEDTPLASARSLVYKAVSADDGCAYALRRYVGPLVARSDNVVRAVRTYRALSHPGIVRLHEAFTTHAFTDGSGSSSTSSSAEGGGDGGGGGGGDHPREGGANELVLVYDFYPGAETLLQAYLRAQEAPLPEPALWTFAVQMLAAVRVLHAQNLTCFGTISPRTLLLVGRNRVKINHLGVMAAFDPDDEDAAADKLREYQRKDLLAAGMTLLALGSRSQAAAVHEGMVVDTQVAAETVRSLYSADVQHVIYMLLSSDGSGWPRDLDVILAPHTTDEYDKLMVHVDAMQGIVRGTVDESRLFRLSAKLNFVVERAECAGDPQWAETGDRYILKLFRDHVFHRDPSVERVKEEMNKLDAGVPFKLLLDARDGKSRLIATYAEVRHCLEQALQELALQARTTEAGAVAAVATDAAL